MGKLLLQIQDTGRDGSQSSVMTKYGRRCRFEQDIGGIIGRD